MKNKAAFTLIEILVMVGILTVLVVSVGGIMGSTFKAKNSSEGNELLSSKATNVLNELKRNILNAKSSHIDQFACPPSGVGASIAFTTKDNFETTLECRDTQIASKSANGDFYFLDLGVTASNCTSFVTCNISNENITSVKFNLYLEAPKNAAGAGSVGVYYGVATPRE